MSESTCPKCRAAEIYTAFRGEKVFDCGSRLAADSAGGWEFASQSEWCQIAELRAENARLRAALEPFARLQPLLKALPKYLRGQVQAESLEASVDAAAAALAGKE